MVLSSVTWTQQIHTLTYYHCIWWTFLQQHCLSLSFLLNFRSPLKCLVFHFVYLLLTKCATVIEHWIYSSFFQWHIAVTENQISNVLGYKSKTVSWKTVKCPTELRGTLEVIVLCCFHSTHRKCITFWFKNIDHSNFYIEFPSSFMYMDVIHVINISDYMYLNVTVGPPWDLFSALFLSVCLIRQLLCWSASPSIFGDSLYKSTHSHACTYTHTHTHEQISRHMYIWFLPQNN